MPTHLQRLDDVLIAAYTTPNSHIAVQMPPRHGKSTLSCHYGPAWFLGCFPERRIIMTTHEASFAAMWGGRVRDVLAEHGQAAFGLKVRADQSARDQWDIDGHEGGMMTAGVGGSITGRGAHLLIVDDPVKNYEDAMSANMRDKTWDWFTTTAYTRREPGAACVVIMTRWHPDDLVGRLTSPEWNERWADWTVIKYPAIGGDGAALWPERFPLASLLATKQALGSAWFDALYQQDPTSVVSGTMFRRQWFGIVEQAPRACRWCRCWDTAATEQKTAGDDPDWFAGVLLGLSEGIWYIADVRRIRGTSRDAELLVAQTAAMDPPGTLVRMLAGRGDGGKRTIDHYARTVLVGRDFAGIPEATSKSERARPLSAAAEAGNVKLVNGAWVRAFLDEAETFPVGAHDDQIDAASGAMGELAGVTGSWADVRVVGEARAVVPLSEPARGRGDGGERSSRLDSPRTALRDF